MPISTGFTVNIVYDKVLCPICKGEGKLTHEAHSLPPPDTGVPHKLDREYTCGNKHNFTAKYKWGVRDAVQSNED